jgi:E3 ubiquitin-protein ligase RNFT1
MSVLVGIIMVFVIHVFGVYWWYRKDDLVRSLIMLPPKEIPPFWHAIFVILVNGNLFSPLSL